MLIVFEGSFIHPLSKSFVRSPHVNWQLVLIPVRVFISKTGWSDIFFRECKGYFKLQKWPSIQIDGHAKIASLLIKPEVCLDTLQIGSLPSIHDMIWQLDISPVLIILIDLPWKPETPSDIATWHWWCLFVLWPKNDPKRRMFFEATNLPITGWRLFLETYWKTFSLGGMITCQKGTDC